MQVIAASRMILLLLMPVLSLSAVANIGTLKDVSKSRLQQMVLIDARPLDICLSSSVSGARCLSANTFQSKMGELASFRDIVWALGTAHLSASDEILIFADAPRQRDAIAGILFLSGHQQIWYWPGTTKQLQRLLGGAPGQGRGLTRSKIYAARMRDHLIVLDDELEALHKAGWQLVTEETTHAKKQPLIVAANSPLASLALFARLYSSGHQKLRVMVDKYNNKTTKKDFYNPFWPGLLLISLASMVVLIIRHQQRGKR